MMRKIFVTNPARFKRIVPACVLAAMAPALIDAAGSVDSFETRVLTVHNLERRQLGIEPLHWNPVLAASAQRWADHLATSGRFEHAPQNGAAPQGENLWAGTRGYFTVESMVGAWVREKRFFRDGAFPNNSTTGNVGDVGHYTQLIWRDTREVGCARAAGEEMDVLVCRYAQPGNYIGKRPF